MLHLVERPLLNALLQNDEYRALYEKYLEDCAKITSVGGTTTNGKVYSENNFKTQLEYYKNELNLVDIVKDDPTAFYTSSQYETATTNLIALIERRSTAVLNQINDNFEVIDTSDINLNAIGNVVGSPGGNGGMMPPDGNGGMTPPDGNGGMTPPDGNGGIMPPDGNGGMTPPDGNDGTTSSDENTEATTTTEEPASTAEIPSIILPSVTEVQATTEIGTETQATTEVSATEVQATTEEPATTEDSAGTTEILEDKIENNLENVTVSSNIKVVIGGTSKLISIDNLPDNAKVSYSSSDKKIATAKKGNVVGKSKGTTIVTTTIKLGNETKVFKTTVKVVNSIVSKITVPNSIILNNGDNKLIEIEGNTKKITLKYNSKNTNIATVNKNGKIIGVSVGKTTVVVTATGTDGVSNKFKVKVKVKKN